MSKRLDEISDTDLSHMEAEMVDELQDLRAAATVYAERAWQRTEQRGERRGAVRRGGWLSWAGAALVAAVLGVGGVRLMHHTASFAEHTGQAIAGPATVAAPPQAAAGESDEALLDQIQSDLNTGVPTAMAPLATNSSATGRRNE